jgi:uncharacterized protein (DUF433 family)
MLPQPSEYRHIVLNDAGQACIEGTRYKVRMLVAEQLVHGWSPWELQWQHEDLTMAEIHAALAYYYDHKAEIDADIQDEAAVVRDMKAEYPGRFTRAELERRR